MRYIAFLLLICSAALAESDVRTAALDGKPELDKPISLTFRAAQIREVLDKVQTETGVRLRPDREVGDDKATVFVKEKPARDVLRALAHCFNLCWTESEVGSSRFLRLCMDKDSQAAMHQRHYDDYLVAAKQFDTELEATAQYIRTAQKYTAPEYSSGQNLDQYWRLGQREAATQQPFRGAMVLQCLNLSESQRKDLFEGKEVFIEGAGIAEEAKKHYPEATSFTFWIERSLGGYLLQGRAVPALQGSNWTLLTMAMFDDAGYDKVVQKANEALLKDPALAKDLPATKPDESIQAVPPPNPDSYEAINVPKPGEGSGATPTTMSDGLLPIAEALGIPVVAQYISEYQPISPTAPPKAGERLAELCKQHKFAVEREGDFLLAKSCLWHRMRDREVPEEKIRRWQQACSGLPTATFETAVEMGSQSWGQVRGTINNGRFWFGTPDLSVLARCEYSLKLYSSLNPTQQRALWEGTKINVSSLKPEQQLLFMQAFELKARPTYAEAKDASWPQSATLSIIDRGLAGGTLIAVAGMRNIGSEELRLTADKPSSPPEVQYSELQNVLRQTEEQLPALAKAFLDKVAAKHPEIPRKSIGIYILRMCSFRMSLGQRPSENVLPYPAKVL